MSLLINVSTKSLSKHFQVIEAVAEAAPDNLYCAIIDEKKSTVDYFFLPMSALDNLKALTSFTAMVKYAKANRSSTPFPPTVNTDSKETIDPAETINTVKVNAATGIEREGVVESEGEALLKSELEQLGYDFSKPKIYAPVNGLGIQVSFFPNKVMGFVFNVVNGVRQDSTECAYNMSYARLREVFNASSPSEVIGLFKLHDIVKPYPKAWGYND